MYEELVADYPNLESAEGFHDWLHVTVMRDVRGTTSFGWQVKANSTDALLMTADAGQRLGEILHAEAYLELKDGMKIAKKSSLGQAEEFQTFAMLRDQWASLGELNLSELRSCADELTIALSKGVASQRIVSWLPAALSLFLPVFQDRTRAHLWTAEEVRMSSRGVFLHHRNRNSTDAGPWPRR